jgi:hypothetical protein
MHNEPVAWMGKDYDGLKTDLYFEVERNKLPYRLYETATPLYTHPVKEQKCMVKDCENHKHEGGFNGDVCSPCYQFIAHGKGTHSQAYRNAKPAELTDEEIYQTWVEAKNTALNTRGSDFVEVIFARAILRKASEK